MNKRSLWKTILAAWLAVIAFLATPGTASAQPAKSLAEQLIGAWYLVSITNTRVDGTKYEAFGPDVNGLIIFDRNGRYSMQIIRRGRPAFVGARMEGTAEENKAAVQGMISHFGTYTFNDRDRSITFHVESSSYPNWDNTDQRRNIVLLVDQLSWSDPLPATGPQSTDLSSDLVWMRIPSGSQ